MHVRILELDGGLDPDEYCKERGADAYRERLDGAKGYFYWLADRARAQVRRAHHRRHGGGAASSCCRRCSAFPIGWSAWRWPTTWPATSAWTAGMVLDSFRKAVADRQEKPIERPQESVRADESIC